MSQDMMKAWENALEMGEMSLYLETFFQVSLLLNITLLHEQWMSYEQTFCFNEDSLADVWRSVVLQLKGILEGLNSYITVNGAPE